MKRLRSDAPLYLWYVLLRPGNGWQLVSYPYYAKYARAGDRTSFRHVDLDVSTVIKTGRGLHTIQGSVSLDDEDKANCTELLPGMHTTRQLRAWEGALNQRGDSLNATVNAVKKERFSSPTLALRITWFRAIQLWMADGWSGLEKPDLWMCCHLRRGTMIRNLVCKY